MKKVFILVLIIIALIVPNTFAEILELKTEIHIEWNNDTKTFSLEPPVGSDKEWIIDDENDTINDDWEFSFYQDVTTTDSCVPISKINSLNSSIITKLNSMTNEYNNFYEEYNYANSREDFFTKYTECETKYARLNANFSNVKDCPKEKKTISEDLSICNIDVNNYMIDYESCEKELNDCLLDVENLEVESKDKDSQKWVYLIGGSVGGFLIAKFLFSNNKTARSPTKETIHRM